MMPSGWIMGEIVRFVLRLPSDMHKELQDWARDESRSLHSLIVWIIRRALKEWRT